MRTFLVILTCSLLILSNDNVLSSTKLVSSSGTPIVAAVDTLSDKRDIVNTNLKKKHTSIALNYIGMHERTDSKRLQLLLGVNPRKTPWCAAYINSILKKAGFKGSGSSTAASFKSYGTKVATPREGDIVVFRHHVGIYLYQVKKRNIVYYAILGGNQSNKVTITLYRKSSVVSIRRPS